MRYFRVGHIAILMALLVGIVHADDYYVISESDWRSLLADLEPLENVGIEGLTPKCGELLNEGTRLSNVGLSSQSARYSLAGLVVCQRISPGYGDFHQVLQANKVSQINAGLSEDTLRSSSANLTRVLSGDSTTPSSSAAETIFRVDRVRELDTGSADDLDGFQGALWGDSRNDIIAAQGTPNVVDDEDGGVTYTDKQVAGFLAMVGFEFEKGCSVLKDSVCRLSNGFIGFKSPNKEQIERIHNSLIEKYGDISETKSEVWDEKSLNDSYEFMKIGSAEHFFATWILGKTKLSQRYAVVVEPFIDKYAVGGARRYNVGDIKVHSLHYEGPYIYEAELRKKASGEL